MSDDREAARLYKLTADQGNADGAGQPRGLRPTWPRRPAEDDREAARLLSSPPTRETHRAGQSRGSSTNMAVAACPTDDREAARLYKLAADQGNATGQVNLGVLYSAGRGGLPKDVLRREACVSHKLAADQGHAGGQANLGFFYMDGLGGLPEDEREADASPSSPPTKGHAWAQDALTRRSGQQQQEERERQREEAAARDAKVQEEQAAARCGIRQHERRSGPRNPRNKADATEQEIRAAYNRLMKRVHPDVVVGISLKQLNAARDVLLWQLRE